jgi:Flp pilus assembly protein protease CpaA
MILLILFLACVFVVVATGVLAAVSDFRGLVIPNLYSGLVIGAFVVCYAGLWLGGAQGTVFSPISSHILAAVVVFAVTLVMFLLKGLGAADSKLGTGFALWTGLQGLLPFLFYMALVGGLLGIAALILRKIKPIQGLRADSWIARVQAGENKVPYGIAIVIGALASFVKLGYFDPGVLSSFLNS